MFTWIPENSPTHLRTSEIALSKFLRAAGYDTCHVGKWHLNGKFNSPEQPQPDAHGYAWWLGTQNNAAPSHTFPRNFVRNGEPVGKADDHSAPFIAREAVTWLTERRDASKPFFLAVWTHEPHYPIASAERYHERHAGIADPIERAYRANVTQLDDALQPRQKRDREERGSTRRDRQEPADGPAEAAPAEAVPPKAAPAPKAVPARAAGTAPTPRPNIVFIMFDDLGYGESPAFREGCEFKTTHIDQLAREGMRFTDAHSAPAVCTPTRYGVLTGRYPLRIGQNGVLTTFSGPIIRPDDVTVGSLLQAHGYHTGCFGKWHLGISWPGQLARAGEEAVPLGTVITEGPITRGFDTFLGFTHSRNMMRIIEQGRVVAKLEPVEVQPLVSERAAAYVTERAATGNPFFLYLPLAPPRSCRPVPTSARAARGPTVTGSSRATRRWAGSWRPSTRWESPTRRS